MKTSPAQKYFKVQTSPPNFMCIPEVKKSVTSVKLMTCW